MSYRDPYNAGHAVGASIQDNQPQADGASQEHYNPYNLSEDQNHPEVYNNYPPPQREPTRGKLPSVAPVRRESRTSGFDQGEFTPAGMAARGPKSRIPQTLKEYRYGHQGNLCTKGGRLRCFGRICCCSLMTTVFLLVSIILALALWIRPPSIVIGSVQTMSVNGNVVQPTAEGLTVNLGVGISVSNPNYFSVSFKTIDAELFYPINNTAVGGGSTNNIVFHSRSQTNFTFPFSLSYNVTEDPKSLIIDDLAKKCGVSGTASNLSIDYKITLGIRILLATISPVISNQFNFPCPISASDISKFLTGKI